MKRALLILFIGLMLVPSISAHTEAGEGIEPPAIVSFIWALHSWTHWLAWIFFIYTCYYFRYVLGRVSGNPLHCMAEEGKKEYSKEGWIKQLHGIFVWVMAIWTLIHLSELVGAGFGYSELPVYSFGEFIPGEELFEWVYVISTLIFLSSCHYFRYLTGTKCFSCSALGKQRQKAFTFQTFLNNYHGYFFWIAIASAILVLLSGGHL